MTKWEKKLQKAERIKNTIKKNNLLLKIALKAEMEVAIRAFDKISDQQMVNEIALGFYHSHLKEAAAKRITDQNILKMIIINKRAGLPTKTLAFDKLSDQKIICEVAINIDDESIICEKALKKINDEILLASLLINIKAEEIMSVRRKVIYKISSDELITTIALSAQNRYIRMEATGLITDQDILKQISEEDSDRTIREIAEFVIKTLNNSQETETQTERRKTLKKLGKKSSKETINSEAITYTVSYQKEERESTEILVNDTMVPWEKIYQIYNGPDEKTAKSFLEGMPVDQDYYYIVVETPEGNFGRDKNGIYSE
ncbi:MULTISPECIES: hypothetical protein [unclassified Oceanispirochaeta]|uniref:hypothetical protein n=1 Tax=unclassified Oceanispirochaeta TaxID=2635722 RepID=UPI0011C034D6|nr:MULTISPECIES: hypothetical protein [unclassified Oceanispirochaeta]MBF9015864.1 hypothetical protein [Oceanispirochaeta sp. M2]NPD72327.1 hypothetical protein [Oceanispirochaeta sp. M1]